MLQCRAVSRAVAAVSRALAGRVQGSSRQLGRRQQHHYAYTGWQASQGWGRGGRAALPWGGCRCVIAAATATANPTAAMAGQKVEFRHRLLPPTIPLPPAGWCISLSQSPLPHTQAQAITPPLPTSPVLLQHTSTGYYPPPAPLTSPPPTHRLVAAILATSREVRALADMWVLSRKISSKFT